MIERIDVYKAVENNKAVVDDTMVMVKKSDLDELEQQRDVAVEALIEDAIELDECRPRTMGTVGTKLWATLNKRIMLITKLTGKTWEEIKAGGKNE